MQLRASFRVLGSRLLLALACAVPAAHAQDAWVVGQSAPLTGSNAAFGKDIRDGALAYFKLVNARGGAGGKPIELVTLDDANDRKTAGANTQKLLTANNAVALFGYALEEIAGPDAWFERAYPDPAFRARIRSHWEADVAQALDVQGTRHSPEIALRCRDGSERHDPDIFVEGFRAISLDAQGRPKQSIAGKRAVHFGDDQTTEIVEPALAQTEAGKPALRVSARLGTLTGDRKSVTFAGGVRAVREAGPTRPGEAPAGPVVVTTEHLVVVPDDEVARTDKAVTIEEPRGIIQAVGLELDHKARTVKLKSGVRGTLQPQAPPK